MKSKIKFVQEELQKKGLNPGPIDGILGPKTLAAIHQVEGIPHGWTNKQKVIGFIQLLAKEKDIESGPVDGLWGPQTEYAFDALQYLIKHGSPKPIWRPEEIVDLNPNNWPAQTPEQNLFDFYGPVGENQTRIELPYPHKLSWDKRKKINSFLCHEKVHDSLLRILNKVLEEYGLEEIKRLKLDVWGGCLNVRSIRGGTRYSTHSWGIALDYDPDNNKLNWGRDKASFARPEYENWWKIWESEGWVSLGRARNFDWMHIQAAKL